MIRDRPLTSAPQADQPAVACKSSLSLNRCEVSPSLLSWRSAASRGDGELAIVNLRKLITAPHGEVAERSIAAVLKTAGCKPREFESHPLRQTAIGHAGCASGLSPAYSGHEA